MAIKPAIVIAAACVVTACIAAFWATWEVSRLYHAHDTTVIQQDPYAFKFWSGSAWKTALLKWDDERHLCLIVFDFDSREIEWRRCAPPTPHHSGLI